MNALRGRIRRLVRGSGHAVLLAGAAGCGTAAAEIASAARCAVTLDSSGIELRGDTTISHEDPGVRFVRDARGNFYGGTWDGGAVLQWAPDGRLRRVIGRPGEGPGELARGDLSVFVVPGDSLYIRDRHLHWVVFDSAYRFVRNAPIGPIVPFSAGETHFLPGGSVVSTSPREDELRSAMAVVDREGRLLRKSAPSADPPQREYTTTRPSAHVGGGRFWVGPVAGPAHGYLIEIWDSTGRVVDSLRRDVPWFRPDPGYFAHQSDRHDHKARRAFPYPMVGRVIADDAGLVWVWVAVPKGPRARKLFTEAPLSRLQEVVRRVIEFRVEVFDPATRTLVATGTLPVGDHVVGAPLYNSRLMARITEDDSARRIRIVSLRLVDGAGRACGATPPVPAVATGPASGDRSIP